MSDIKELQQLVLKFRKERGWDWEGNKNPKDLAISLSLEAAELLEHFQWKDTKHMAEYLKTNRQEIGEELCDVLWWVLLMAHDLDIDLPKAFKAKVAKNEKRYPLEQAKKLTPKNIHEYKKQHRS